MNKVLSNIKVYDLEESVKASGYPMLASLNDINDVTDKDFQRALKLTKASLNNGAHAQFLTGIRVNFDLTFSNKAWVEAERYRFLEFVSSQSTMHRITKMDIDANCNSFVTEGIKTEVKKLIDNYNKNPNPNNYLILLYNIPSGFQLTARMTTNYRCLLNIFNQRWDHRLPEWREFCKELLILPYFAELVQAYLGKIDFDFNL